MSRSFDPGTFAGQLADSEWPAWLLARMDEPALRETVSERHCAVRFLRVPTHWPPFCIRAQWVRGSTGPAGEVVSKTTNGRGGYPKLITRTAVDREQALSAEECLELDGCLERLAPWNLPAADPDPREVDDGTCWLVEWRSRERCGVLLREESSFDDDIANRAGNRHLVEIARILFRLGRLEATALGAARERSGDDESTLRDLLSGERVVVSPDSPFLPVKMSPFESRF